MKKLFVLAAVVALSASPVLADAIKKFPDGEHGQGTENTRNGAGEVSQSREGHESLNK